MVRRKGAKNRGLHTVNENFEHLFNAARAASKISQSFLNSHSWRLTQLVEVHLFTQHLRVIVTCQFQRIQCFQPDVAILLTKIIHWLVRSDGLLIQPLNQVVES